MLSNNATPPLHSSIPDCRANGERGCPLGVPMYSNAAELTRMKDFENALCAVMQADLVTGYNTMQRFGYKIMKKNLAEEAQVVHAAQPIPINTHFNCSSSFLTAARCLRSNQRWRWRIWNG